MERSEGYIESLTWSWDIENAQSPARMQLSGLREVSGDIDPIEASLTFELAGEPWLQGMVLMLAFPSASSAQIPGLAN